MVREDCRKALTRYRWRCAKSLTGFVEETCEPRMDTNERECAQPHDSYSRIFASIRGCPFSKEPLKFQAGINWIFGIETENPADLGNAALKGACYCAILLRLFGNRES